MAWIRSPREKSPYYTAVYKDETGKLREKSTKTKDPILAQRIANAWEDECRAVREGLLPKRQYRLFNKLMFHVATGEVWERPTVKEFFERFVRESEIRNEGETVVSRKQSVKLFLQFLQSISPQT